MRYMHNAIRAHFHNNLIRRKFNPKYRMHSYTYVRQTYQERTKQNMQYTYESTYISVEFVRTTLRIIWSANISINTEGKSLIKKFGPGLYIYV